ncbi:hypothetical protein BH10PLA2_BH10PLA2_13750 [soil metagenome]
MPSYPHRIRLRGPWEYEVVADTTATTPTPLTGKTTLPCSLAQAGLTNNPQTVRFLRRFGLPRFLDASEHIWLIVQPQASQTEVILNEYGLAHFVGSGQFAVECTTHLLDRNLLEIVLQARDDQDGLTGETYLEIRQSAYLQNARAQRAANGHVQASVEIAGKAPANLDMYLLANRQSVAYARPSEQDGIQLITLESDGSISSEISTLSLELVYGGVVWYQLDCSID